MLILPFHAAYSILIALKGVAMKKIAVLLLLVIMIAGCQMYKTKDTIIENKSSYAATVDAKNFKENEKQILSYKFTVDAGKSLVLPMYNNGDISLVSIGRYYLNKVSDTRYEILDAQSVSFAVYNKTNEDNVILSDSNALFDTQILTHNAEIHIDVFNSTNIRPIAIVKTTKIILQTEIQHNKIIIKY